MGSNIALLLPTPIDDDCESGIGPRGKGDPEDLTLRPKELTVNIPAFQSAAINGSKCKDLVDAMQECADNHAMFMYNCWPLKKKLEECVDYWTNNLDYKEEIVAEYLLIRQEFRKTGRNRLYRALKGETYLTESQRKGYQYPQDG